MKRANSVTDALNTGNALLDFGDNLPKVAIPLDGDFGGEPGPPGAGVPTGGSALQVIRKNAANTTTEWADVNKSLIGLNNVDNTSDVNKPVSNATQTALGGKADKTELNSKADLVGGKIPVAQLPATGIVTDSSVAAQVNSPETGAEIDGRINTQVTPIVEQITADYVASDQAVIDAAAAAVDANPKIATLEVNQFLKTARLTVTAVIDTLPPGAYYPNATATATAIGLPTANFGVLQVHAPSTIATVQTWTPVSTTSQVWQRVKVGSTWYAWGRTDAGGVIIPTPAPEWWKATTGISSGTDISALTQGVYRVSTTGVAESVGLPTVNQGALEVFNAGSETNGNFQRWTTSEAVPQVWVRARTGTVWQAWVRTDAGGVVPPVAAPSIYPIEREMRLSAFRARRGVIGTDGPAVCLVFDHGTNFFGSKVLPILRELGLPATLGLNSKMLDPTYKFNSHDNLTTWAQVQGWALSDGIEIWNHGRFHNPGSTDAATVTEIVGGRQELETLLPKVPVEGWLHTGAYGGFNSGDSAQAYWTYPVGGIILGSHAIATGNIQGSQALTGEPVPGRDGLFLDTGTAPVKNAIIAAQKQRSGFMVRHHPQFLDAEGYITTADLRTFLEWVAAERDAGRLTVLTGGGLALGDASTAERDDIADPAGWATNTQVVSLASTQRARGSVREFSVHSSTASTVTFTVTDNTGALNLSRAVAVGAGGTARASFTIPLDAGSLTFTAAATGTTLSGHRVLSV